MGTITLPNFRTTADVTMNTRLKDGGLYIDLADLTDIKAWLWSDAQKTLAGRCDVRVDAGDSTKLICEYASTKAQYPGVNRLIVQATYMGATKTYDKPVFNFVRWTGDQAGQQVTIDDPEVDVEIEVQDVSSSILDAILSACVKATAEARDVVDVHRGPAAGFGIVDAEADNNTGDPEVEVETSGDDAAKNFHFKFKNIKGIQGIQGIPGRPGVESCEITIDNSTGTPVAATSVENGVLKIEIHGIKGEQGNTGSSVDYPYELVNNRTTDDATKGLSAAEGKRLGDDIGKLSVEMVPISAGCLKKETVDVSSLGVRNYYIDSSTGKYTTNTTYKHSLVPVSPGQSVRVTSNRDNSTSVSFFKTDAAPVSGGTPDYSDAYTEIYRVGVPSGTYKDFIVPADAHFMYVYRGSGSATPAYPYTPASIVIMKPAFNPDQALNGAKITDYANVNSVADAAFGMDEYDAETLDLGLVETQAYSLGSSGSYQSTGSHGAIPVSPGDVLKVTGNGGRAAFVRYFTCPSSGTTANAVEVMTLEEGKVYVLQAPENAVGLVYNIAEGDAGVTPQAITKYTHIGKEPGTENINASRFSVSNNALEYAAPTTNINYMFYVRAGRRYGFYLESLDATVRAYTFNEIPRPGLQVTMYKQLYSTNTPDGKAFFAYVPSDDGYILFHSYKSGGPSYTVKCYDETAATFPVSNGFDIDEAIRFWRINMSALTLRSRAITADYGLYGSGTSYKNVLIPVEEGEYVKIVGRSGYTPTLAWLTSNEATSDGGTPPYVSGTTRFTLASGILKVPAGAKYLFVYCGGSPYNSFPLYLGKSVNFASMPDIVRDNDFIKTRRLLEQLTSQSRSEMTASYKPLVLLHYSDIHGRTECQNRINEYREFWKDYIDDTIQTGDLVTDKWADDTPFGDTSDPDNPNRDILSVIGNHDTATGTGNSRSWHAKQGVESYNRYIAPFVENWDVVQPDDAAENGYCFYYKDYDDSKIRLVVIDAFDTDESYQAAQRSWVQSVLADARTNGLSVIMASHFRIKCETLLTSPFTKPTAATSDPDNAWNNDPFVELVKDFIDDGGKFVCWITGHSHYDAISKTSVEQGSQINVCVAHAGRFGSDSTDLYKSDSLIGVDFEDWKTFDLFNVMAVDTYHEFIVLFRVGSSWDKMGRKIETCCIKYKTGEILYP